MFTASLVAMFPGAFNRPLGALRYEEPSTNHSYYWLNMSTDMRLA